MYFAEMEYNIVKYFVFVSNPEESLCFCYLRMALDLHREQVLFHQARHVLPPCFYSSPEQNNGSREEAFSNNNDQNV